MTLICLPSYIFILQSWYFIMVYLKGTSALTTSCLFLKVKKYSYLMAVLHTKSQSTNLENMPHGIQPCTRHSISPLKKHSKGWNYSSTLLNVHLSSWINILSIQIKWIFTDNETVIIHVGFPWVDEQKPTISLGDAWWCVWPGAVQSV